MQMNTAQTTTPKTKQQFERVNKIVAAFRDVYKKSCRKTSLNAAPKRYVSNSCLASQKIREAGGRGFVLKASNERYETQLEADMNSYKYLECCHD